MGFLYNVMSLLATIFFLTGAFKFSKAYIGTGSLFKASRSVRKYAVMFTIASILAFMFMNFKYAMYNSVYYVESHLMADLLTAVAIVVFLLGFFKRARLDDEDTAKSDILGKVMARAKSKFGNDADTTDGSEDRPRVFDRRENSASAHEDDSDSESRTPRPPNKPPRAKYDDDDFYGNLGKG